MNRIPFRSGSQIVPDLIAGRVHFYVSPTIGVVPQYQAKQARLLGVTSPERLNVIPEVPTLKERGIDYVRYGFLGICGREGTPQPIVDRLNKAIVSIVATPEYRELIEKGGSLPESSTPQRWGKSSHRPSTTLRLQSRNSECSRSRRASILGGRSGRRKAAIRNPVEKAVLVTGFGLAPRRAPE